MTDNHPPMHDWASDMWRMPRSLTGDGVRHTLRYLKGLIPDLKIIEVPSGTKAYDWEVPLEWNCREASIRDAGDGTTLISIDENNLHVLGYSTAVDEIMTKEELDPHLYSLPDYPDAIPYITSYYKERWGFCLNQIQRDNLGDGPFHVYIDSSLTRGSMTYGELIIPGETEEEILLSTYVCHPQMANDNLSGVVVTAALAQWLTSLGKRRYTYRILFIPETIGSIYYLSRHLDELRRKVEAGFVLSCCGDDGQWTHLPSPSGVTLADRAIMAGGPSDVVWRRINWNRRGSDERQWCLAGLPISLLMRSGFGGYPEYHTSLDDLSVISQKGLGETFQVHKNIIIGLENNYKWRASQPCEPFLSKHGLYPETPAHSKDVPDILKIYGECDGKNDLFDIVFSSEVPLLETMKILDSLVSNGLVWKE